MAHATKDRRIAALQAASRTVLSQLAAQAPLANTLPFQHRAIFSTEYDTVRVLAEGRTKDQALAVGTNMTQQATLWITEILDATHAPIACQAGCPWCCTLPVAVSPPEALLIAHHLRTTLTTEALAEVRARLKARTVELKPLSLEAHAEANLPCALLTNGCCGVYEARPVACRTWTSPDATRCEQAQGRPWDATVTQVMPLMDVLTATQLGVTAGLCCSAVSAAYLELHSAVLCALDTPRAAERWVQGELIFRDCRRMDRVNEALTTIFDEMRQTTTTGA
jgi:Fe-S-cluster containining protein